MTDISRVGLYGLTYKKNDDNIRESPNQYHDLDDFLAAIDFVVIMVKHDEIKENMKKPKGKTVLDCHNICNLPGTYRIKRLSMINCCRALDSIMAC